MEAFRIAAPLEKVMRIQYVQRDMWGGQASVGFSDLHIAPHCLLWPAEPCGLPWCGPAQQTEQISPMSPLTAER